MIDINFVSIFAHVSWRNLRYLFVDPLSSFNWCAVLVGEEELKLRQLAHHTVKNGVNSIHSWGVPQTGLKLPPRVYSKGVYVPSRV